MSFDAWVVGFGLSALLQSLHLVENNLAFLVLFGVGVLDTWLLYRFFTVQLPIAKQVEALRAPDGPAKPDTTPDRRSVRLQADGRRVRLQPD
jgi:hypothetical protein